MAARRAWGHHQHPWRTHRQRDHGPLRRRDDDRFLGGVAAGLAARLCVDVTVVRIGLVLAALASGIGVAAYVVAWLVIPAEGDDGTIAARALGDARGLAVAASLIPVLVVTLLIASALGAGWLGSLSWPAFVSAAGLVLIWRNGTDAERTLIRRAAAPLLQLGGGSGRSWSGLAWRLGAGVLLALGGVLVVREGHRGTLRPLGGVGLVLAAFVVVFGPWWLNVARQLVVERQGRLRAEERADLAARVHDSVLQTLALIQRNADQPQRVAQLARAQERELRSWLFDGARPGRSATTSGRSPPWSAASRATSRRPTGSRRGGRRRRLPPHRTARGAPGRGREATVNAAKWSGAEVVSLFVEVEEGKMSLFVRDRGRGFDPLAVAPDRRGISQSIQARMTRAGGHVVIRTAPGGGTDVELTVPPVTAPR